jgi:hypothetical protein
MQGGLSVVSALTAQSGRNRGEGLKDVEAVGRKSDCASVAPAVALAAADVDGTVSLGGGWSVKDFHRD